jgi:hypothetical protein
MSSSNHRKREKDIGSYIEHNDRKRKCFRLDQGGSDSDSSSSDEQRYSRRETKSKKNAYSHHCDDSTDSTSSEDYRPRIKRHKKGNRKKDEKKEKKKEKKKKRETKNDTISPASAEKLTVRRSAITGKKIKMHIEKSEDDLLQEQSRKELLRFMNSSF